jgi:uncharacterized membrane protein YkvA (DUF1232 family)
VINHTQYNRQYSAEKFWRAVTKHALQAGKQVIERALILYYSSQSAGTPITAKLAIYGALGYFISPIDAIPDIIPVSGYVDDIGALGLALKSISEHITPAIVSQAKYKLQQYFK